MEQNHLHGQQQEFRIRNNPPKTKENDVKTILFSLAYLTQIKLLFCMSTWEREREISFKKNSKPTKDINFTSYNKGTTPDLFIII